ncbi:hypothetical protein EV424DRAFT_1650792 [Suillus variegatus]|nr:hypothetical protein EV424DRAFT_1650792 [Suillus variegatus]
MGKRTRADSARNANLAKALVKKKKINNENKENPKFPLVSMRKFATRSLRFMDAYRKGLNGKQAAFATKKYRGHRTLPLSVFDDLAELN